MKRIILMSMFYAGMLAASSDLFITDYVASRDKAAIISMLEDDSRFLSYDGNEETTGHRIETSSTQTKVARKNDVTVGFCSYEKYPDVLGGCIYLIAVDKNYRQQGYATKMMQTAIDDFRSKGVQEIEICVHRENQSAMNLYQKRLGFKLDGKDDAQFLILSRRVKNKNWCCW